METVTISLNGREVSGREGTTILELARQVGVDIPTLCHHPLLKNVGACRVCLVEEGKTGRLLASCITPITSGMEIRVNSPPAIEARRGVLELILSDHPSACVVCNKGNQCVLRDLAKDHGICDPELDPIRHWRPMEEVNPFVVRDLSKCVLCGRCIRICQDFEAVGAVEYVGRGYLTHPGTAYRGPLEGSECNFCGSCVAICPTDALAERDRPSFSSGKAVVSGICGYCGTGCHVEYELVDGLVVGARGVPGSPVNDISLCVRGRYGQDAFGAGERLIHPLIRQEDGTLRETSWQEALEETAGRLKDVIQRHGPAAVGIIAGCQCSTEELYLAARFARSTVGTPNVDSTARLTSGTVAAGLGASFQSVRPVASLPSILEADTILLIGARPDFTHPVVARNVRRAVRNNGAVLIQLDPLKTTLSRFARVHIREEIDQLPHLLVQLMKEIVSSRRHDEDFIRRNAKNADDFLAALESRPEDKMVNAEAKQVGRFLGKDKKTVFMFGRSVARATHGYILTRLVADLALLCGQPRKVFFLFEGANEIGAWEVGCSAERLPGFLGAEGRRSMEALENAWGKQIAAQRGLDLMGMIRAAEMGTLKALIFLGVDPLAVFPDTGRTQKTLAKMDLVVRTGLFPAVTDECAHIVFPMAAVIEADGTYINVERRAQAVTKIVEPPGEAKPNARFLIDLAGRLGPPMEFVTARDIFEEIRTVCPGWERLSRHDLKKPGGEVAASPEDVQASSGGGSEPESLFVAYQPPDAFPQRPQRPADRIWKVFHEDQLFHPGDGVLSGRSRRLAQFRQEPTVRMNPIDAESAGLTDRSLVLVRSDVGEAKVRLVLDADIPGASVAIPRGGPWYILLRLLTWPEEYCPVSLDRMFVAVTAVEE